MLAIPFLMHTTLIFLVQEGSIEVPHDDAFLHIAFLNQIFRSRPEGLSIPLIIGSIKIEQKPKIFGLDVEHSSEKNITFIEDIFHSEEIGLI